MSRSFLTTIRNAIFSPPESTPAELSANLAEAVPQPFEAAIPRVPAAAVPAATHPPVAADLHGRFATVAQAKGIAGSGPRVAAALELAAIAPDMGTDAIIAWVAEFVPAADPFARRVPSLAERAAEMEREFQAMNPDREKIREGWADAMAKAEKERKLQ